MRSRNTCSGKFRRPIDLHALAEVPFLFNTIGLFFAFAGLYVPYYYVGTYALHEGIPNPNLAFYLVSIMNAVSIAGRIISNFLADKAGPFNVLIPCSIIAGILCLCRVAVYTAAGPIFFSMLHGFFSGSFLSLPPTTLAALTKDMSMPGTRSGIDYAIACFGVLIGTPICGAILSNNGGFLGLHIFGGCCVLAVATCIGVSRVAKAGRIFGMI